MKRLFAIFFIITTTLTFSVSCNNANDFLAILLLWLSGKSGSAPVLNNLVISDSQADSIMLAQPTLSTAGEPTPTVQAYIGINGTISVSGSTVSNSLEGPVDVSAAGYEFSGLSDGISYKIIVVAQNSAGYSVMQIVQ